MDAMSPHVGTYAVLISSKISIHLYDPPALFLRKITSTSRIRGCVGPGDRLDAFEKRKDSCSRQELSSVPRLSSLVTALTKLSQIPPVWKSIELLLNLTAQIKNIYNYKLI